jgi:peptidoglycan/xylan/chitin deacetylase (PgdA/CDA1 family)
MEYLVRPKEKLCILTCHGLGEPERPLAHGEEEFWLTASFFKAVLDLVLPYPNVRITFDDSNSSDFRIGLPALLNRGMKATFFVVSERIDQPSFLSSKQIQELAALGMTIGSHGNRHRRWAELSASELHEELTESRSRLESVLGQPVREAACPFGSYNRRVLKGLRNAGYTKVYTSDDGLARANDWLMTRNTVVRTHGLSDVADLFRPRPLFACFCGLKTAIKRYR